MEEKVKGETVSKVIDDHLKIRNIFDLSKYLDKKLGDLYDYSYNIENNNSLTGYIDGLFFSIIFVCDKLRDTGSICCIVDDDYLDDNSLLREVLKRRLTMVMWGLAGKEENSVCSCIMECSYDNGSNGYALMIWDTMNPKKTMFDFINSMEEYGEEGIEFSEFKIHYPITEEELRKEFYYGTYTGNLSQENIERIQNMSEFELFYSIRTLEEEIANLEEENPDGISDKAYTHLNFAEEYMLAQTSKFGIKSREPHEEYEGPNYEQCVWLSWWEEALDELLEQNPNLFEDWNNKFKNGVDPNFRPKISLKKFTKKFEAERQQEEIENQIKQQIGLDLVNVLTKISEQKKQKSSVDVRARELFEEVLLDTDTKEKGIITLNFD